MATYAELRTLSENETLRNKVQVACVIAAEVVRNEVATTTNHVARVAWAQKVFNDPVAYAQRMLWALLAQNAAATSAVISGASDGTVQTAVNAAIDVFAA